MAPAYVAEGRQRHVAQKLVADRVVGRQRRRVGGGGLRARVAAVGLEDHHRLAARDATHAADELGSVVEALHVRPDLLHRRVLLVVVDAVLLVHIARVSEGNELGNPVLASGARQLGMKKNGRVDLVQQSRSQGSTLREKTHITDLGLRETAIADEQRVHIARIIDTHTVGSNDTAMVLLSQTTNFFLPSKQPTAPHLRINTLLRSRLSKTTRHNRHPFGTTLQTLLQRVHRELCRNGNDRSLDSVRNVRSLLVDRLSKQLSS